MTTDGTRDTCEACGAHLRASDFTCPECGASQVTAAAPSPPAASGKGRSRRRDRAESGGGAPARGSNGRCNGSANGYRWIRVSVEGGKRLVRMKLTTAGAAFGVVALLALVAAAYALGYVTPR